MNVFYLDENPILCAQYHCDAHVRKMLIEYAQLLCDAHHVYGTKLPPYQPYNINHPAAIWVRESVDNYSWLLRLGVQLSVEYVYRFKKQHATFKTYSWLVENVPDLPSIGFTEPRQVVPSSCIRSKPIDAYRALYATEKARLMQFTERPAPEWLKLEEAVLCLT